MTMDSTQSRIHASLAPRSRRGAASAPKLRDSCHSCAVAKVKCHKEKPLCSRCVQRGLACEYMVTRRAGRRNDRHDKQEKNDTSRPGGSDTPAGDGADAADAIPARPSTRLSGHGDVLPEQAAESLSPAGELDDLAGSTSDPALSVDLGELLFPEHMAPAPTGQPYPPNFGFPSGFEAFLAATPLFPFPLSASPASVLDPAEPRPSGGNVPLDGQVPGSPTRCGDNGASSDGHCRSPSRCLTRVLELVRQLDPGPLAVCTASKQAPGKQERGPPNIQNVIVDNERAVNAVMEILQCPCTCDGHLLVLVSLIACRILERYRDGASTHGCTRQAAPEESAGPGRAAMGRPRQNSVVVDNYTLDGDDSDRMALQLVLSKLHRVQRLINHLDSRMDGRAPPGGPTGQQGPNGAGEPPGWGGGHGAQTVGDNACFDLSGPVLRVVGIELKKKLRGLSQDIVVSLRGD